MPIELSATFNDEKVVDFIYNMQKRLKNVENGETKYVGLISALVYRDIDNHFKEEKGSKGPWAKWSPSYTEAVNGKAFYRNINGRTVRFDAEDVKASGGTMPPPPRKPGHILQASGVMRNHFVPTKVKASSRNITWFNDAKTKSGFPYAAAHDNGGDKLPKRDFMWLSDKALEEISVQTLQFMIDEGI